MPKPRFKITLVIISSTLKYFAAIFFISLTALILSMKLDVLCCIDCEANHQRITEEEEEEDEEEDEEDEDEDEDEIFQ